MTQPHDSYLIIKALRAFAHHQAAHALNCLNLAQAGSTAPTHAAAFRDSATHHRAEADAALALLQRFTAPSPPTPSA